MIGSVRRTLVLWHVDHTLIENGCVSKENYALAFHLLMDHAPAKQAQSDGRTDVGIMAELMAQNVGSGGVFTLAEQLAALVDCRRS